MSLIYKSFIISLLIMTKLVANDLAIDDLLKDIEKKSDLSEKTKLENSGISFIYTRDDLRRMQAKYLKDILKSSYSYGYNENRHGIPDPLTMGTKIPYVSGIIRVYIDNQEITSGLFGSGIVFFGDIDIGFVDHIEIYTQSPTYEYTTEATYMMIKLYSKKASKDEGGKLELNGGSYGAGRVSAYYSQELDNDWSYFTYLSHNHDNRKKYMNLGTELSRDKDVTHLFSSIYNDNQHILLDVTKQKRDSFMSISLDGTPLSTTKDTTSIHLGYDSTFNDFSFLATYDYLRTDGKFTDDVTPKPNKPLFPVAQKDRKSLSSVYSLEIKHNFITDSNKLTTGIKYRYKTYAFKDEIVNGIKLPEKDNDTQTVSTIFGENKYSIADNSIITTGLQYSQVLSNNSDQDDNLFMYKLGYTHLYDNWIFKLLGAHSETALEPYLIDSEIVVDRKIKKQEADNLYSDIIYTNGNNKYELLVGVMKVKNYLMPDFINKGKINNLKDDLNMVSALFRWTYKYNRYDKLFTDFSYQEVTNMPNTSKYKTYSVVLRSLNTYKKFDFFNEIVFYKDNVYNKAYYDYSNGVMYQYSNDITFSLKGENLFNKAKETNYNMRSPDTLELMESVAISPIDRKITFSFEYLF